MLKLNSWKQFYHFATVPGHVPQAGPSEGRECWQLQFRLFLFTGTSRLEPIKTGELTSERDLLLSSVVFYFTASRRNDYYYKKKTPTQNLNTALKEVPTESINQIRQTKTFQKLWMFFPQKKRSFLEMY